MNIKLLLNRVIIKQDEAQAKTSLGLIFPDSGKQKPLSGKIISIGEEVVHVKEGDNVLYENYKGAEIMIEGRPHMIMTEKDVIGIVN